MYKIFSEVHKKCFIQTPSIKTPTTINKTLQYRNLITFAVLMRNNSFLLLTSAFKLTLFYPSTIQTAFNAIKLSQNVKPCERS